jgi:tetratricopeptide (TPR) repeat protein
LIEAWYSRGTALGHLGRNEAAIASYNRALQINPDFYLAWYSRGVALSHIGDYEGAISSYEEALRIRPDFPDALSRRNLALNQGKLQTVLDDAVNEELEPAPESAQDAESIQDGDSAQDGDPAQDREDGLFFGKESPSSFGWNTGQSFGL